MSVTPPALTSLPGEFTAIVCVIRSVFASTTLTAPVVLSDINNRGEGPGVGVGVGVDVEQVPPPKQFLPGERLHPVTDNAVTIRKRRMTKYVLLVTWPDKLTELFLMATTL